MSDREESRCQPAMVIGVSGNVDPVLEDDLAVRLEENLRELFKFLWGKSVESFEQGRNHVEARFGGKGALRKIGLGSWKGVGPGTEVIL